MIKKNQTLAIISLEMLWKCTLWPVDLPRNHVSCSVDWLEGAAPQTIPRPLVGWLPRLTAVWSILTAWLSVGVRIDRCSETCPFFKNHHMMFFGEQMVWRWATVTCAEMTGQMCAFIAGKFQLIHDFRSWRERKFTKTIIDLADLDWMRHVNEEFIALVHLRNVKNCWFI